MPGVSHATALAATHFEPGLAPARMPAYSRAMSNRPDPANQRPAPSTDRPTAAYPTAAYLARLGHEEAAHRQRLADLWADRTPTEELPAVGRQDLPARPATRQARSSRARRHLRAALAGALAAATLLTGMSLYAADGISSARRAAVEQARSQAARPPAPAEWTVHGTDAPYSKDDPTASPLDLPRCTTSPDTPMPCLAHISNDSHHVVVLEEDASLTGLDRR